MSDSPRILVASNDPALNFALDGLLGTFRAGIFYAESEATLVTFLTAAEGFDMIVLDTACAEISMEAVYRTLQKQPPLNRAFLLMLLPDLNPGRAIFAYNLGADALLPRQFEVTDFLAVCRDGIRQALTAKRLAALERKVVELEHGLAEQKKALEPEEPEQPTPTLGTLPKSPEHKAHLAAEEHRPPLVQHLEKAILRFFAEMKVSPKDITSTQNAEVLLRGDFIGWTGIFLPATSEWYDVVLNFTRPGIEYIAGDLYGREADDNALHTSIIDFVGRIHTLYRENSETGRGPSSAVFTQPLAAPRFSWIGEMGTPSFSQLFRMPKLTLICDFYQTRGTAKIKPAAAITPGDVMNENIAAPGQIRLALVNRGVVLTEDRLRKIIPMVEASRNFWVIEPSLMTRQLHSGSLK